MSAIHIQGIFTGKGFYMPKLFVQKLPRVRVVAILAMLLLVCTAPACFAQDSLARSYPVRTDSPRHTFQSLQGLTGELEAALLQYRKDRTEQVQSGIYRIRDELLSLIDLSPLPEALRRKQGVAATSYLLDILGRVELPELEDIPDASSFDISSGKAAKWRIPDTPIEIVRVNQGPREGEFLFSARTVEIAPRFYNEIQHLPLKSRLPIKSWHQTIAQFTGPMIPAALVSAVPDALKQSWLDTPIWKILGVVLLSAIAAVLLVIWNRLIRTRKVDNELSAMLRRLLTPLAILLVIVLLEKFAASEINIAGDFADIFTSVATLLEFLAAAWIFWLVALLVVELIIRSPNIPDQSLDASLLRLCARVVAIVGSIAILAYAGHVLGMPVFSLIAGLGIGGLAVALAIRPTLENLVGGMILYADRPVRVGDFCKFNEHTGTIENIGARSTQVRALDRTLISVPNAKFADMEIVNWAHCDQMLINAMIGLRYETQPDQLRHVLAELREMFYAHPKIDTETVRVRFTDYGASSLDITIRVYALTREWNEYYAIREDVLLRIAEIVNKSGTGFAFPSQTLYVRHDEGLDPEQSGVAEKEVDAWRASGKFPFPNIPASRLEELADTLDYPPRGSPDALSPESEESVEPLSADAGDQPEGETKPPQADGPSRSRP